jgi:acid stress-induced BolA-like protein IbaG/YrbA
MSDLTKQIEEIILGALPNAQVMVRDPMNDGSHFEATVISESFVGMPLVKQHRQVMQSLKDAFAGDLHALALKTYTPEKWARTQG